MNGHKFGFIVIASSLVLVGLVLLGSVRLWAQEDPPGSGLPDDGQPLFAFNLELQGATVAGYADCIGLGSSNEIDTAVVATEDGLKVQKTPGALEWHTIVLTSPTFPGSAVRAWREDVESGDIEGAFRDGAIQVYDRETFELVGRWEFQAGWAARLTISEEGHQLVIVHEGLARNDEIPRRTR